MPSMVEAVPKAKMGLPCTELLKTMAENDKNGVGVSCRNLYSFVVYLYVNGNGSITSVGEERDNFSAVVCL